MITSETLSALDREDPLAPFRDQFDLPEGVIYLDGNSLGPLPRRTLARLIDVAREEWGQSLIRAWNDHDWIAAPQRIGDKIATIIGAERGEVVAADSTSVNLFKLMAAACGLRADRRVILTETGNFPTDIYMAEGLISVLGDGYELRAVDKADIASAIDKSVAVVSLTHVDYRSGEMLDMAAISAAAHEAGALILWDLSHSAGAVTVDLNAAAADFAVGCGYKYLNGGPGAPAFLFVAEKHHAEARQPLSGWMGHAAPFAFEDSYRPADGIARHLAGTPGILGLAALEQGLDLFLEADMAAIRHKSVLLTEAFIALVEQECAGHGFSLVTPRDAALRGSQVSFRHPDGYPIMQALIARGVIGDFRTPDILRFGFAPLYVRFRDAWTAVSHLSDIMESGDWDRPEFKQKAAVT
ncbi:MAG: kynureninase [Alphaproteobacteria bacterium]